MVAIKKEGKKHYNPPIYKCRVPAIALSHFIDIPLTAVSSCYCVGWSFVPLRSAFCLSINPSYWICIKTKQLPPKGLYVHVPPSCQMSANLPANVADMGLTFNVSPAFYRSIYYIANLAALKSNKLPFAKGVRMFKWDNEPNIDVRC